MSKMRAADLAVFGGAPAAAAPLHVGRPNIGDRRRLMNRIEQALDRRWLSNDGPFVREFEEHIADLLGVRHCVAMCNATVAIDVAARALELRGEVIVPAFTFVATAHALAWQGITPVFCDIDPRTHNLDPAKVEACITPRTTGIVGVHVWGRACDPSALRALADRRGLRLMFDAAHAFLCSHEQRMLGGVGDVEVFSFHATKFCNAFEGGAAVTNDDALAGRLRMLRNFGFADYDTVTHLGTNGKLTEISAAMGLTSLESVSDFIDANRRNYLRYRAELGEIPGLHVIDYDDREHNNYQYIVVDVDAAQAGLDRDQMQRVLWAENVMARRYFYPGVHRMEPYRSRAPKSGFDLPHTESLTGRVLCLPTGTAVGAPEIRAIADVMRVSVENAEAVREQLTTLGVTA
jgi:dTDP-4-amino-4,6-dideoxygalactose transaminase